MTLIPQNFKIREFLKRIKDPVDIEDKTEYQRLTIRINNKGISIRDTVLGESIGTKRQYVVQGGQFLLSKIDAMNGAFGVIPLNVSHGVITSNFWAYKIDLSIVDPEYFFFFTNTDAFRQFCIDSSSGTTNRRYLDEEKFLERLVPLPPLDDQRQIVEKIHAVQKRVFEINSLQETTEQRIGETIHSLISFITNESERKAMKDVAPLIRRSVKITPDEEYLELGLRSFGKGSFHKPAIRGDELNGKRLFRIEPGDLLFSNVFAWEGAVAVAQPEDAGRYGSHRFISRKTIECVASADFLYYYFTTPEGVEQLGKASPGSAGRNRTLGLKMLDEIKVPLPSYEKQLWIVSIAKRLEQLGKRQALIKEEMEGLFKSVLDQAFKGDF